MSYEFEDENYYLGRVNKYYSPSEEDERQYPPKRTYLYEQVYDYNTDYHLDSNCFYHYDDEDRPY